MIRVTGTLREMTEMKRSEELVSNTEKLVFAGQLAVGIAHEIRNPLTTIKGMLQFVGGGMKPEHYRLVMSEIDRIHEIVDDFMVLGKPQPPSFAPEPCQELLEETLQMFEFQCRKHGIVIRREFTSAADVLCERNPIKQVLLNVLRNAAESMPQGGEIAIGLDIVGGYQRIIIRDTGEGMTKQQLERVGEPFHTTKRSGNGLGLMIVKRILAAHSGSLQLSAPPGKARK